MRPRSTGRDRVDSQSFPLLIIARARTQRPKRATAQHPTEHRGNGTCAATSDGFGRLSKIAPAGSCRDVTEVETGVGALRVRARRAAPKFAAFVFRDMAQGRILSAFSCAAVLLLFFNSLSARPTQFVSYRPSTDSIWSSATNAMTSAASSLGLMDGSTSAYSESATADALEAFRSLSSSGFGASGNGASGSSSASSSNGASSATRTAAAAAGSAAAGLAAAAQPVNIPKGCLITKWSAVWLVHADRSRSHVGYPTPGCESSAFPITADDGLCAFGKAPIDAA